MSIVNNKKAGKKAFTLIELLGVIILLSVISLIAIIAVNKNIMTARQTLYNAQVNNIIDGARNWSVDNVKELPESGDIYISLAQLKQGGYIEDNIKSPNNDNKCFPNTLEIKITSTTDGKYEYSIANNPSDITYISCDSELLDTDRPTIILSKDTNSTINEKNEIVDYVEVDKNNHSYQVLGYTFYDNEGHIINAEDYSNYDINITVDGVDISQDKINNITVDISQYNKTYKIVYKIKQGNKEFSAVRNVIVKDTTPPVLALTGVVDEELDDEVTTTRYIYKVGSNYETVSNWCNISVSDNSLDTKENGKLKVTTSNNCNSNITKPGTYTVMVETTDASNNKSKKSFKYIFKESIKSGPTIVYNYDNNLPNDTWTKKNELNINYQYGITCNKVSDIGINKGNTYITIGDNKYYGTQVSDTNGEYKVKYTLDDAIYNVNSISIHSECNNGRESDQVIDNQIYKIDKTGPSFGNVVVSNETTTGYDVCIQNVQDSGSGMGMVKFPTWTENNNQDDIQTNWESSNTANGTNKGNGEWCYHINVIDHKNEYGAYITEVYLYDAIGNSSFADEHNATVPGVVITYDNNYNNQGTFATKTQGYNSSIELPSNNPTREGYTFAGWYDAATNGNQITSSTKVPSSNVTYYAHWNVRSYTLTYDCTTNGGSTSNSTAQVNYNSSVDLTKTCTKSGWTFKGWANNATDHTTLTSLTMGSSSKTIYAVYSKDLTATFSIQDTNAATSSATSTKCALYNKETSCSITAPTLTNKSGYTAIGWNTNSSATTSSLNSGASTDISADTAYYSITKYNTNLTATFYYYNNQNSQKTCTKYNGASSCSVTAPTLSDQTVSNVKYTKRGFSTSSDGNATINVNSGASVSISSNTNYYASYQASITATFYYCTLTKTTYTYSNAGQSSKTASATRYMKYNGDFNHSNYTIPTEVTGSNGGASAENYIGVSSTAGSATTMTPTTEYTSYYAVYTENLVFYYYNGSAHTSKSLTRRMLSNGSSYSNSLSESAPTPASYNSSTFKWWSTSSTSYAETNKREPLRTGVNELFAVYQKSISVSYNANGGISAPAASTGTAWYVSKSGGINTYNPTITLSTTGPTRTGYSFSGWYKEAACTNSAGATLTISADTTVFAKWVDDIAPTVNVSPTKTTNANADDYVKSQNITISATDSGSDLKSDNSYQYFLSTSASPTAAGTLQSYSKTGSTVTMGTTGIYYLFVKKVSDNANNVSTAEGSSNVTINNVAYHKFGPYKIDSTPPTTGPTITVKTNNTAATPKGTVTGSTSNVGPTVVWTNVAATKLEFSGGADANSGVAGYAYSTTAGGTKTDGANTTLTATTSGVTYYVYTKDKAGNYSTIYTAVTVKLDTTAPTLSVSTTNGTTYEKSKTATVTIADTGGSGLSNTAVKIYYAWGTSAQACSGMTSNITITPTEGAASATGTITINSGTGAGKLYVCNKDAAITDRAGNSLASVTTRNDNMYLDNTAPTTGPTITVKTNNTAATPKGTVNGSTSNVEPTVVWTNVAATKLEFSGGADGNSGVAGYAYSTTAGGTKTDGASTTLTATTSGVTYFVYTKDKVGNYSTIYTAVTVKLDTTAPTLSVSVTAGTTYAKSKTATVTIADTGGSGLSNTAVKIYYAWGTSAQACSGMTSNITITPTKGAASATGTITINSGTGAGKLYICNKDAAITDRAGNALTSGQTRNVDMYLDNTPPQIAKNSQNSQLVSIQQPVGPSRYTLSFDIIEQASYSGHTLLLESSSSDYKKYNKTKCYDNATGRQDSTFRIKTVKITNKQGSTNSQITVSNISKSKTGSSVYWRDCNSGGLNEICQSGHGGSVYGWPGHDNPATLSWSFTTNATFNFIEIVPDWQDSGLCNDYRFSNIKFGLSGQEKYVQATGIVRDSNNKCESSYIQTKLTNGSNYIWSCPINSGNTNIKNSITSNIKSSYLVTFTVNFTDIGCGEIQIYDGSNYNSGSQGTCSAEIDESCDIKAKDSVGNIATVRCNNTGNVTTSSCGVIN